MNIFKITKDVRDVLVADTTLKLKLNNQIFCLDAKENTTLPFITIDRLDASDSVTKDYVYGQNCTVAIAVFSKSYAEAVEIAERVYNVMTDKFNQTKTQTVMSGLSEDVDIESGVYWQVLTFEFGI